MATNVWVELPLDNTGGGGSGVTSFNSRTGAVLPLAGDYTASQITNVPSGNIAAVNVQNALNELDAEKQPLITGAASTITSSNLTINRAVISNASGKIDVSVTTSAELAFVSGVTSNIQTQLNAKGVGSVTSVALSTPGTIYSVSGSPVTTSGTLTLNLLTQTANTIFAGPTTGAAATPTFRAMVAADLDAIIVPVANGGTNSSTALNNNRIMVSTAGAIKEASALTNGQLLIGSTGAAPVAAAISAGPGISVTNGAGSIIIGNTSPGVGTLPPGLVGDGVDGNVTIAVNTTLTRDMYYNNLTVNAGVTLNPGGYVIYVKGTLTIAATGFIARNGTNGGNASGATGGAAGTTVTGTMVGNSGAGAVGVTGSGTGNGSNGGNAAAVVGEGGAGGVGGNAGQGNSGATAGGAGGNGGVLTPRWFRNVQAQWKQTGISTFMPTGTGGGAGGSSGGDGVNVCRGGGGGGSGGGAVFIICDTINNSGTIQSKGGNGGNGANGTGNTGGGGGGGGGSGGKIMILTNTVTAIGTLDVSGGNAGNGGTGAGTGTAGAGGGPGGSGYATVYAAGAGTWTTTS